VLWYRGFGGYFLSAGSENVVTASSLSLGMATLTESATVSCL